MQQFDDVSPTGAEASVYPYVQELKAIGITSGTSTNPPLYSPQLSVTRGQMAVFLIRAGFNTLLNPTAPIITQLSPTVNPPGRSPVYFPTAAVASIRISAQVAAQRFFPTADAMTN